MVNETTLVGIILLGVVCLILVKSVVVVQQQQAIIVERLGRYRGTLSAGIHILIPFVDIGRYTLSLKEEALDIPEQTCITRDNVQVGVDGILYFRVMDPSRAAYGVSDFRFAVSQLAQTALRSELGKIDLDKSFEERNAINQAVVVELDKASEPWGVKVLRYEIKNINPPRDVLAAMEKQMRAEREKRATILQSEGERDAQINEAEGAKRSAVLASEGQSQGNINTAEAQRQAITLNSQGQAAATINAAEAARQGRIKASEAERQARMNQAEGRAHALGLMAQSQAAATAKRAEGHAKATVSMAEGRAQATQISAEATAKALARFGEAALQPGGHEAIQFRLAERYIRQFGQLAKQSNTLVVPADAAHAVSMVQMALAAGRNVTGVKNDAI